MASLKSDSSSENKEKQKFGSDECETNIRSFLLNLAHYFSGVATETDRRTDSLFVQTDPKCLQRLVSLKVVCLRPQSEDDLMLLNASTCLFHSLKFLYISIKKCNLEICLISCVAEDTTQLLSPWRRLHPAL